MSNDELENECSCKEGSITGAGTAMAMLKRKGLRCLGCVHSSIKEKVLKRWNKFLKKEKGFGGRTI